MSLVERSTHIPVVLFATSFSWWFEALNQEMQPALAGLQDAPRSPAEAGFGNTVVGQLPPTEVGGKQCGGDVFAPRAVNFSSRGRGKRMKRSQCMEVRAN